MTLLEELSYSLGIFSNYVSVNISMYSHVTYSTWTTGKHVKLGDESFSPAQILIPRHTQCTVQYILLTRKSPQEM